MDFNQPASIGTEPWDDLLLRFIQRFKVSFQRLELLMTFYRGLVAGVTAEDLSRRTGYRLRDVENDLSDLEEQGLLRRELVQGSMHYSRIEAASSAGQVPLKLQVVRKMAETFNERKGRLTIIFSILKGREQD